MVCALNLLLPLRVRGSETAKKVRSRSSIFKSLYTKVSGGNEARPTVFEDYAIWRDKSGRELWARWCGKGLYINGITVRTPKGNVIKRTYFSPQRYYSGQEHCLCIVSDGGIDEGTYDFDITYSTSAASGPTLHFETSAQVEESLYRGHSFLASATIKKNLSNELCIDVEPTFSGEVYSATLYFDEERRTSTSYFRPQRISADVKNRFAFRCKAESETTIQLVLEGFRFNGRPFYLLVEGLMP